MSSIRTRFAPSPTGQLHLGHARAAFEVFGFAERHGGTCLLRVEDIDHTRCRPEYTRDIYRDLHWLGLDWPLPVRVQSSHYSDYARVITELVARGLAYPCTLTRRELKAGQKSGADRVLAFDDKALRVWSDYSLADLTQAKTSSKDKIKIIDQILKSVPEQGKPNLPFTIRLDLEKAISNVSGHSLTYQKMIIGTGIQASLDAEYCQAKPSLEGWINARRPDPIIARRDIGTSYDIAVTHDDALQNITHVVRGRDLEAQTPLHVLIQTLMNWPTPVYYHHDLVLREDGEKLAKRNLDTSLASLREAGQSVKEVKRLAGL